MTVRPDARPDILIASGLDPSGGAGFLADASVVRALGGRPVGVITALTVQTSQGLRSVHPVERDVIGAQLGALLSDVEVKAVKIGMLASVEVVEEIAAQLALTAAPVVWDPVMAPTHGGLSFPTALFERALQVLGPHLALITPNAVEAGRFAGADVTSLDAAIAAGTSLARRSGTAVLVKGGHLSGADSVDVVCHADRFELLRGPRLPGPSVHGTGCALSTSIATELALGTDLDEACRRAKDYVAQLLSAPVTPGRGAPSAL